MCACVCFAMLCMKFFVNFVFCLLVYIMSLIYVWVFACCMFLLKL